MDFLLIWDIDGTLIQGRDIGRRAMDLAFEALYGIREGFSSIDMSGMVDGTLLEMAYTLHGIKDGDRKQYFKKYCEYLKSEADKLTYPIEAPGIIKLLDILKKQGFYNILGTGNIEKAARIKLEVHDMNKYFPLGGFGDLALDRWQVIENAILSAQKYYNMEFPNQNIYIIGDTPRDIECGRKLNVKSIGVATGGFSYNELMRCGADYVFEDLTDIDAFLEIFE